MSVDIRSRAGAEPWDVERFLAFYEGRPDGERWELVDGAAYMMTPPNMVHQRIADNLQSLLNMRFRAQRAPLWAYREIGVRIAGARDFHAEPDVAVVAGPAGYEVYTERFLLAAEVRSASNSPEAIERKLERYREAPDNLFTLVIDQRATRVALRARATGWREVLLGAPADAVELEAFAFRCTVGDLYDSTPLDPRAAQG